ncbi:sulfatase [Rubellicoccus peritrichatus]|uniref:Sulfatase n=1 Tax=Rubellicoccus peritrichatus TaxID=3080537 RepID=A0AAQ3LGA6_9BACT|nr:sulfatase [Puniceicoccus sp. CR14]WOO43303.1 sulfatase [Puniceicoccus sp. CR14]
MSVLWTLFCALAVQSALSARQPNIILIVADDLGWMDSSAYGSEFYQTSGIDRLAREGVLFTDAYSANPLCSPTRASILTGQYPSRLRFTAASGHSEKEMLDPKMGTSATPDKPAIIPQSRSRLPNEYLTYAEILQKAGYATAFMGKWHLGKGIYIPEKQGFEKVVGGRHHPGPPPPGHFFAPWNIDTIPDAPEGTHIADVLTDEAISFIKDHRREPFLLNLWYYDVHAPFQGKPELIDKYEQQVDPSYAQKSATMGAMIEAMDQNIERLLDELDKLGIRNDTIIIFSSDNGGNMYDIVDNTTPTNNAPLRSGKGNNYEGGVRVPLIVSWPGVSHPGTSSDAIISSVDFYPTILHMAGLPQEPDHHIDGVDFTSAIEGKPFDRGPTISHFPHYVPATDNLPNTSVRVGDYKFYRFYHDGENQKHRYELYNLKNDIGETKNLADAMPDKVAEMDAIIDRHIKEADVLYPIKNPAFNAKPVLGWQATGDVVLEANGSTLDITSEGGDPRFSTKQFNGIIGPVTAKFSMRSDSSGEGQFFWVNKAGRNFHRDQSATFKPKHDGRWHEYTVELPFSGKLKNLRLDPSRGLGRIEIKDLKLVDASGESISSNES